MGIRFIYHKMVLVSLAMTSILMGARIWPEYKEYTFFVEAHRFALGDAKPSLELPYKFYSLPPEEQERVLRECELDLEKAIKKWEEDPSYRPPWHRFHSITAACVVCSTLTFVFAIWFHFKHKNSPAVSSPKQNNRPSDPWDKE